MSQGRVDVHAHYLAPSYREALGEAGISMIGGIPLPPWSPELALEFMDAHDIDLQMLSVSDPGVSFLQAEDAATLATASNDYIAGVIDEHPKRFRAFAVLPLDDPEIAAQEAERALSALGFAGVGLLSNSRGRYLGDPYFDSLLSALDRRSAWAFVHPTAVAADEKPDLPLPDFIAEYPFDTTRAIISLLINNAFRRYPRIRWHFAHGGGTIPMLRARLNVSAANAKVFAPLLGLPDNAAELGPNSAEVALRRSFYDTALIAEPPSLAAVASMSGVEQMLFGSDWPFAGLMYPPEGDPQPAIGEVFSGTERAAIERGNAQRLLDAVGNPAPSYGHSVMASSNAVYVPEAPPETQIRRLVGVLDPLARLIRPKVYGVENVPDGGALLVGNHTLYAFLDLPFMLAELWKRRHIWSRGLGEHGHYRVPVWRNLLELCGMVRGTRENLRALMATHEYVVVFPGGAREVFKHRDERYRLLWRERMGFARLAIEQGYPIVPFAAVGAEEMLEILADDRTPVVAQVSDLMKRLVGISLPPIVRGVGPTVLPQPQRLYFWFGEPIETRNRSLSRQDISAVRDETKHAIEAGIDFLLDAREADPNRSLRARLRARPDAPEASAADTRAWFVRRAFEAWNTDGPEAAAAWAAPDIELEDPHGWPDAARWKGREMVLRRLTEVTDSLGGRWADLESARAVGVEVLVSMSLRDQLETGSRSLGHFFQLVTVEGSEIKRIRVFLDEDSAAAALDG